MANANTTLVISYHPPQQTQFQWSMNGAMQLILERRAAHDQFANRANRDHNALWTAISNNIFAAVGFIATANQYRTKQNTLKRGYENLQRIMHDNPEAFQYQAQIHSMRPVFRRCRMSFGCVQVINYFFKQFIYIIYYILGYF